MKNTAIPVRTTRTAKPTPTPVRRDLLLVALTGVDADEVDALTKAIVGSPAEELAE